MMIQLHVVLIFWGIAVNFWEMVIILSVPFAIKCLRLKKSLMREGSYSPYFTSPATSSSTRSTFKCVCLSIYSSAIRLKYRVCT